MRLVDLLRFGFTNLWRRKGRTVMTMIAMAIGVTSIIVLVSVGLGYEEAYAESVEEMGSLTKIDVLPASDKMTDKVALLNDKAVEAFKKIDGVEAVTPVVNQNAYIKTGNYVNMVKLYGIDLETAPAFQITPMEGRAPGEGYRMHPEVMFSDDVAPTFANPSNDWEDAVDANGEPLVDVLNSNIKLTFDYNNFSQKQEIDADGRALPQGNFYRLNVAGVCSNLNSTYSTAAFMDQVRLEELIDANADFLNKNKSKNKDKDKSNPKVSKMEEKTYDLVWVKVKDIDKVQSIARIIQDAGLSTYTLNDVLENVRKQSRMIQGVLGVIGSIAMLVSAICVAITMMMSVTERTREIGILKVLGTKLSTISGMFLIEAFIVGIFGGILGLSMSYLLSYAIEFIFAEQGVRSLIPLWLALSGIGFSGLVALIAALIPAKRAMRISPNAAIRAE